MALPELTYEQRVDALNKALEARRVRAKLKQDLCDKKVTIKDVLAMDDPAVKKLRVFDLISALPGIGKRRAEKIMDQCNISYSRRVKGLGRIQREDLLRYFN